MTNAMTNPVFRDYDQTALDAEYDNFAKCPDGQDWATRYVRVSKEVRETVPCHLDISYGPSDRQKLDIFPADQAGAPVHIFIHGGYWRSQDKENFAFTVRGLRPAGITTVIVEYDLCPQVSMGTIVQQCREAAAWVWREIENYGGDRNRITVSGHSAGGHLTATTSATDWAAFGDDLPPDLVKGAVGISGLYDLEPIRLTFLNVDLKLDAQSAAAISPVLTPPNNPVPITFAVGEPEGREFLRQSTEIRDSWQAAGCKTDLMVLDGLHHFSIVGELENPDSTLVKRIVEISGETA